MLMVGGSAVLTFDMATDAMMSDTMATTPTTAVTITSLVLFPKQGKITGRIIVAGGYAIVNTVCCH